MRFRVGSDNRSGSIKAQSGGKSDSRDDNYNIDPGKPYGKVTRTLAERHGTGDAQIEVSLVTSSEFVDYQKEKHECARLVFKSKGTIKLPKDAKAQALGVVQDSIAMGFRVEQPCKVQLTASVVSDMDVAEIRLQGPAFDTPIRIYDEYDEPLDLSVPGEYILKGAYQLNVRLPNSSLGGRPLTVEMEATLSPIT
jgi:hypothetical protein